MGRAAKVEQDLLLGPQVFIHLGDPRGGDLGFPFDVAGPRIERHHEGVVGRVEDPVAVQPDAPIGPVE